MKKEYLLENASVLKETEKAIQVEVWIGDSRKAKAWFPKSQVQISDSEIWVSAWILEAKDKEICGPNEAGIAAGFYPNGKTDGRTTSNCF